MTNLRTNFIALIDLITFTLISINTNAQLHIVKPNDNVAIGMDDSNQKLEVVGNVNITGREINLRSNNAPKNTFIGFPVNDAFKTLTIKI